MLRKLVIGIALTAVAFPAAAAAHVTLQPGEWEAGAFATPVVRVPNERDDAGTTTVTVQFPETIPSARFKPHRRASERSSASRSPSPSTSSPSGS